MPLLAMCPNIQDGREPPSRKRSHEDCFGQDPTGDAKKSQVVAGAENIPLSEKIEQPSPTLSADMAPDSPLSEPMSLLDDIESITATRLSPSPDPTPLNGAKLSGPLPRLVISLDSAVPPSQSSTAISSSSGGSGAPSTKRKRLTSAEKDEKAKADAARKQEKEEQKAALEAKKRAQAEEREKKKKQKEEEDKRKAEEKEAKRRQKEEEEKKIQDAKNKKERSQLKLNSFFNVGATTTPKKTVALAADTAQSTPSKPSPRNTPTAELSEYDRLFKPFFIKENVIVATSLYGLDEETKRAKSRILDEYLSGSRGQFVPPTLNTSAAVQYFHLPCRLPRGRRRPTVRKIMFMLADTDMGDVENPQTKMALDLLKTIPMKFLGFREDVRPAYYGTATNMPAHARLSKVARNPMAKTELPLNYDYDSEAEWVDDGDGEDVDDLDDEEEEVEEDEEMADFLDDSEDALPLRAAFSGGMEPESTGLCWENQSRQAALPIMDTYRMEFILDCDGAIDPLSTKYWETQPTPSEPSVPTEAMNTASVTSKTAKSMAPPPPPADAFAVLSASTTAQGGSGGNGANGSHGMAGKADPKKAVVAAEFVGDFKKAIMQYSKLSKLGIVEILSAEFEKCTKSQIKNSLEAMAERTGAGQHKTWKLKDGVLL